VCRIVPGGRFVDSELAGKRRGLLRVVAVAKRERQRKLLGEIARRGVVEQPPGELRVESAERVYGAIDERAAT
jgi:hypothetical protein